MSEPRAWAVGRLQIEPRTDARALLATTALLIVGLAGCATELTSRAPADTAPHVGVFTGEFADGKPVYRFPTIVVVGSRSGIGPDI